MKTNKKVNSIKNVLTEEEKRELLGGVSYILANEFPSCGKSGLYCGNKSGTYC
jgi:uncharacterized protein YbbK (DUF523 family)